MPVAQLVYVSTPAAQAPAGLDAILQASQERNACLGITGLLVSRDDLFLQLLEGPRQAVTDTFARILRDPRHSDVTLVTMQDADLRLFAAWSMKSCPLPTWLWSPEQVAAGAPRQASGEEMFAVFHRLAATP
jgi:hypothetical protein